MTTLETLRQMGPDNYKQNSLKLAAEIIQTLKSLAAALVSKYEIDTEKKPYNKTSNQKSIDRIMETIGKFEGRGVSAAYGEPIEFNQTSMFREPFKIRVDLVHGRKERVWHFSGTEQAIEIGFDFWEAIGFGQKSTDDGLSSDQIEMLRLIENKQQKDQFHREYINAKMTLKKSKIDLANPDILEFGKQLDQANSEYWEALGKMKDSGVWLDDLITDDKISGQREKIEKRIVEIKQRVIDAKMYFETRKKYLEDAGLDPEQYDIWGKQRS